MIPPLRAAGPSGPGTYWNALSWERGDSGALAWLVIKRQSRTWLTWNCNEKGDRATPTCGPEWPRAKKEREEPPFACTLIYLCILGLQLSTVSTHSLNLALWNIRHDTSLAQNIFLRPSWAAKHVLCHISSNKWTLRTIQSANGSYHNPIVPMSSHCERKQICKQVQNSIPNLRALWEISNPNS